jgi:hypothetical protein
MRTIAGQVVSESASPLWDEPIYLITVTTPYTKKRNAKRKRGWAGMPVLCVGDYRQPAELHGAN